MRLLVTIPHYCRRTQAGAPAYGSESGDIEARLAQVTRCITALHQTFGPRQALAMEQETHANDDIRATAIDIVLVTSNDDHLVERLPKHLFIHIATTTEPRHLGFVCHHVMRDHAAEYDWFAYLEDDLEITDALFFDKIAWFTSQFGPSALLQPNRFEVSSDLDVMKLYVDGNTTTPELQAQFQDTTVRPLLEADALGRTLRFKRVNNVHSGAFVLNAQQLARVAPSPMFGKPTSTFFGPLESAATLMIMRAFDVYKPARENAAFLELHHLGRRFLIAKQPEPEPAPEPATAAP